MNKTEKALQEFKKGYNCAQSVLAAFASDFAIDETIAKRLASGLGAGFGRLQNTCGAVTGAILAIGAKYHDESKITESKETTYLKTREFIDEFTKMNTSINCLNLLGVNIMTTDGMKKAKDNNLFVVKCEKYVADAVQLLEQVVL